jgi:hypothetical protein
VAYNNHKQGVDLMPIVDWIPSDERNTKIAIYDQPGNQDDAVKITGLMMFQKEKWVCLSRATSQDILRVTNVPSMEFLRDPAQTVEQAIDPTLERYQRPADRTRLTKVANWFVDDGNFIVNSGLVWLPTMGAALAALHPDSHGFFEKWDLASNGKEYDRVIDEFPDDTEERNNEFKKCSTSSGIRKYQLHTIDDKSRVATPSHIRLREVCDTDNGRGGLCGWTADKYSPGRLLPVIELLTVGDAEAGQKYQVEGGSGTGMQIEFSVGDDGDLLPSIVDMGDNQYLSTDDLRVSHGDGTAETEFKIKRKWFDICYECGWTGRPGHLIDGQHRTRGALDSAHTELLAYNVIQDDDFDSAARSKIFSEVTNTSEPLDLLHRLNLAFRASQNIKISSVEFNFTDDKFRKTYQIAAKLTRGETGKTVMKNRISLLPRHPSQKKNRKGVILNVFNFIKWTNRNHLPHMDEDWWEDGGPWFHRRRVLTETEAYDSFYNYWAAISEVFPANWDTDDKKTKEIQKSFVEPVFKLYPTLVARIRDEKTPAPTVPSKEDFASFLRYIGSINFSVSDWDKFGLRRAPSGNAKRNHQTKILRGLISDAVATTRRNVGNALGAGANVNDWVKSEPTIDRVVMVNPSNLGQAGRVGEAVNWTTDTTCRPRARQNEPHLLLPGYTKVEIHFGGICYYSVQSRTNNVTIKLPIQVGTNPVRATGDQGKLIVINTSINNRESRKEIDVTW